MTGASTALDWRLPYPGGRQPVVGRAMVATSQPLAAQAGLAMLRAGGNAVDAALAAAITLTVVEPVSNGIGGDLFALVWDPQGAEHITAINASGRAPAAWTPERFASGTTMPMTGWDSVTVPGCVDGWRRLSEQLGRLPFARLFDDAIGYAEHGFPVSPVVADKWAREGRRLGHVEDFAGHFLRNGQAPAAGTWWHTPHAADTLREIAATGGASFYRGALASAIAAHAGSHGALLTSADLAAQWDDDTWVRPIHIAYRGHTVHQLPPNAQGIATLIALGILEHLPPAALQTDDARRHHLAIEAMKLAFIDTYRAVADPAAMRENCAELLDPRRLSRLAGRIRMDAAGEFGAAIPPWGGTVYVCSADAQGMMVSLIQSNFYGFGSGIVVPGTGISLHNRAACFSLAPGHANRVAGGARPLHTIIPALVTREDASWGVLGVTGGPIQPQGQVQMLLSMIDGGLNPQAAVDAPRWKIEHRSTGLQVDLEPAFDAQAGDALRRLGHPSGPPGITGADFGGAFAIRRAPDCGGQPNWIGGADPRRDGQVAAS